jgi:D-aspartate ligase
LHTVSEIEVPILRLAPGSDPPVIALGAGVTLTAVLRLLHQNRIAAYAVSAHEDIAARSRFYRALPDCGHDPQPDGLENLLRSTSLESGVLIPCADDWLQAVARLPLSLSRRFPSSTAPLLTVNVMTNKWRFADLLDRRHIPHPKTQLLRSARELALLSPSELENSILKPVSSVDFARRYGSKGFLVRSREEAIARMAGVEYPIMLQEFIPGPSTAGYFVDGFVDARGSMRARFVRQRLRMYPPKLGNSTLMISVSPEHMRPVFDDLNLLFATTGYRGIVNAEFKFDQRDVCSMTYRDALGLSVETVESYIEGRRCVMLANDFLAWRHEGGGVRSLTSWARPWLGAESALLHWNDPRPGIAYGLRLLKKWVGRSSRESPSKKLSARGRAAAVAGKV